MGAAEVINIEDGIAARVAELDAWLETGHALRDRLALDLYALRMARDPLTVAAVADAEKRAAEGRPYEDAVTVDDLEALVAARR